MEGLEKARWVINLVMGTAENVRKGHENNREDRANGVQRAYSWTLGIVY